MRLSELTVECAMVQAITTEDAADASLYPAYLGAAVNYVLGYTGLTIEEADNKPELAVAALVVFAELVKSKEMTVDSDKVSPVLESFLGMHSINLL